MNKLSFVPLSEIRRIQGQIKDRFTQCQILSDIFRINVLYMIEQAGSGHIGTSFSAVDVMTYLFTNVLSSANTVNGDLLFSSKGHDVPALYSILIGLEKIPASYIHKLRRLHGLGGHPDISTPFIVTNTGSLGMGISKAKGMVISDRLNKKKRQIYVMCGDGELEEGQFWESLQGAVNGKFGEITVIVDCNKIQSDTWVSKTSDLGNLEAKLKSFGWEVARCDGHDFVAIAKVFAKLGKTRNKPKILIADTTKGKGVSFMEKMGDDGYYKFHSGAPSLENYQLAFGELSKKVDTGLSKLRVQPLKLGQVALQPRVTFENPQKLVAAFSEELVKIAKKRQDVVAMDADLVLDCGLIPFKNAYPGRYVECGISEQDMVSMAGGLALLGKLPIVNSFACFLSTRPNEQIYNNATERTKIIYVGSLAGLLPAGPGHSHQSVRDISALGSIPGLIMIEPCCEVETRMVLRWAVNDNKESTYIRLVSIPCEVPYKLPKNYRLRSGIGIELLRGRDVVIIAYGPVMLSQAYLAAAALSDKKLSVGVINLPWLNRISDNWLKSVAERYKLIVTIDNHYVSLGQGIQIAARMSYLGLKNQVLSLGLASIPQCGQNDEVLRYHRFDSQSLSSIIARHA